MNIRLKIYRSIFFSIAILGSFLWLLGITFGYLSIKLFDRIIDLKSQSIWFESCGALFTIVGSFGSWYYNNRLEKALPYIQPLRIATAIIEIRIECGEGIVDDVIVPTSWKNKNYIIFNKENEELIKMSSNFLLCTTLPGENIWSYRATMNLERYGSSNKDITVYNLKETKSVEICLYSLTQKDEEVEVVSGDIVCLFNNSVQVVVDIPPQKTKNGIMYINNVEDAFTHFRI